MNKQVNVMTEAELQTVTKRVEQVFVAIDEANDLQRGMIAYAMANGYTEEEANRLVVDTIIPTVDNYNAMCRENVGSPDHGWFFAQLRKATVDMSLADECKFKLGILMVLNSANADVLSRVGIQTKDEREAEYKALSDNDLTKLDAADYNEEIKAEIDRQLEAALDATHFDAEMMNQVSKLIENHADEETVHGFVTDLWQDESYKYCAALAGCVARRNHELPSIPEDASDVSVIVGVCQGIDAVNVAVRVSRGELVLDKAFSILKTIANVGLCILATAVIAVVACMGAFVLMASVLKWLGDGMVASILALAAGGFTLFAITGDLPKTLEVVTRVFTKIADCTYGILKKGVKTVIGFVEAAVIPSLKGICDRFVSFVGNLVHKAMRGISGRTRVRA